MDVVAEDADDVAGLNAFNIGLEVGSFAVIAIGLSDKILAVAVLIDAESEIGATFFRRDDIDLEAGEDISFNLGNGEMRLISPQSLCLRIVIEVCRTTGSGVRGENDRIGLAV